MKAEPMVEQDVPIISGHLVSHPYEEGSIVKSGDVFFQVDPRPFQTAVTHEGGAND